MPPLGSLDASVLRPIVFTQPLRNVPPSSWIPHVPFAFWLVDALRPAAIVELGTHSGNSYSALVQGTQAAGMPAACVAVDTWRGDHQAGFFGEDVFEDWSRFHETHFASTSRLIRTTFDEALASFAPASIDLLHIDGLHTYEAVRHDFHGWLPKMSARGVVILHDTAEHGGDFGVWRLWEELERDYPTFSFPHAHGLGIAGVGTELPPDVRWLLTEVARHPDATRTVRRLFAALGERLVPAAAPATARLQEAVTRLEHGRDAARLAEAALRGEVMEARRDAQFAHDGLAVLAPHAHGYSPSIDEDDALARIAASGLFDASFYLARYPDVAAAGMPPLRHFLHAGAREGRQPHPLFSIRHYLRQCPHVALLGINPLLHFLAAAGDEQRSPHPLFDLAYYREQQRESDPADVNPLVHFLQHGAAEGRRPHPLFDPGFYRRQLRGASADANPLLHYLTQAPGQASPHPLFDHHYYLTHAPDVARAGLNPLVHFLETGWREGRRPNRYFDPLWYLATHPDVTAAGRNPLEHFARHGWREGRDPSPEFSVAAYLAAHPDVAAADRPPLEDYLANGAGEGGRPVLPAPTPPPIVAQPVLHVTGSAPAHATSGAPTIVFVSHAVSLPARAGNEYRALRLLTWLHAQGHRVLLVVAAQSDDQLSSAHVQALHALTGNVIVCRPDGRVRYQLTSCPDVLSGLHGRTSRPHPDVAGSMVPGGFDERDFDPAVTGLDRALCHDVLIDIVQHAVQRLTAPILFVQYVWMARLLAVLRGTLPAILDTIDVYSTKAENVLDHGVDDHALSGREEAARLTLADLVLAVHDRDRTRLQLLTRPERVITVGVDFDVPATAPAPAARIALLIGSGNPMNRHGVKDFLRFAWPAIRARVPDARLLIAGHIGDAVPPGTPAVETLGLVEDLDALYARARVVINPAVAGTGLKIKTVEALAHLRPIVAWANGVEGLPGVLQTAMPPVQDWDGFAAAVVAHLETDRRTLDPAVETAIRAFVSPAGAYGALADRLARMADAAARAVPSGRV